MSIPIPANLFTMFSMVIPLVMFDVLEQVDLIQDFFEDDSGADFALMDQMKDLGYETQNVILNLGTLFVLMCGYFLKALILFVVIKPSISYWKKGKKVMKILMAQVVFKEFIYLFMEGYIEFLLSGSLAATIQKSSVHDHFAVYFTKYVVLFCTVFALPSMLVYIIL